MQQIKLRLLQTNLFLLFLFDVNNFPPFIMPAFRADGVGQAHFAAVGALNQIAAGQCVMGATPVSPSGCVFSLWMRCHGLSPKIISLAWAGLVNRMPATWAGERIIRNGGIVVKELQRFHFNSSLRMD
jgi:hypothetical protein